MKQALHLARKGNGKVFPNPMVGCLIVKDGRTIGQGFHEYFGGPHAEVNALKQAGDRARGATLYVTLEPCAHWGKTPPCADAIIRAGISRVVAAMSDPNHLIAGKGFRKLKSRGIEVVSGVLEQKAQALNRVYIRSLKDRKSRVIVKAAMTLDGKIATRTGDSRWITGPMARAFVHKLRSRVDAIMVGINTVLQDDCELTSHGKGKNPVRVVIDPHLKIPLNSRVLDSQAPTVIFHGNEVPPKKLAALQKKGVILKRVLKYDKSKNFKHIIKNLANMSIYEVLLEGGGETIAGAIRSALVDEVFFFISPKIVGGRDAKTPVEGPGVAKMALALPLKDVKTKTIGPDILVTGRLKG